MAKEIERPWIAIDGCIGAGKTTLALLLSEMLKINIELEKSSKHPFLEDFYAAPDETALQTELLFVLIHYHQISRVIGNRQGPIVTDFTLAKDLLFARMNLAGEELSLFLNMYNFLNGLVEVPTLLIHLEASDDLLWRRVKLRDRPFERNMKREYLQRLNLEYADIEVVCGATKVLKLCADELDIINNEKNRDQVIKQIAQAININYIR